MGGGAVAAALDQREVAGGEVTGDELTHDGLFLGADLLGARAPRAEAAPAGRIQRRRQLAPCRRRLHDHLGVGNGNRIEQGPPAIHLAAYDGNREMVDLLLELGADPTVKDHNFNATPSGWARHAHHESSPTWSPDEVAVVW